LPSGSSQAPTLCSLKPAHDQPYNRRQSPRWTRSLIGAFSPILLVLRIFISQFIAISRSMIKSFANSCTISQMGYRSKAFCSLWIRHGKSRAPFPPMVGGEFTTEFLTCHKIGSKFPTCFPDLP
jgi:hypothetical protein